MFIFFHCWLCLQENESNNYWNGGNRGGVEVVMVMIMSTAKMSTVLTLLVAMNDLIVRSQKLKMANQGMNWKKTIRILMRDEDEALLKKCNKYW